MVRRLAAILAADVAGYSRLMSADEAGTLAALQAHRSEVINPAVARHGGRVVKLMGDGILAEFGSVVEAVGCAADMQREMAARNATIPDDRRMSFRIGVHLGDIIIDGDDIYGDGVNIAARLEGLAETGGIRVSRQVQELVEGKLALTFRGLGPQNLKNIPKPVEVFAVELDGSPADQGAPFDPMQIKQEVKYCRAPDGVRIAYSQVGRGPPMVKTANWMNHLEDDWQTGSVFRHFYAGLARDHTLIRYDARGNGLSDWDVEEVSLEAWVSDLETVVDAVGVKRFPLLGLSQGGAISIAYAVRHPERVSHLIILGGFARGRMVRAKTDAEREKVKAMETLIRVGWGEDNPAFRQIFASQLIPDATKEQLDWFNEMQRRTASPACAARYFATVSEFDVTALLPKVTVPTLVMHAREEVAQPVELGRELAAGIPGAKFVAFPGRNHIPLEQDSTTARALEEIGLFLSK
jgi:class 3 adenylate cyclase/pimeloyl-ACP methyl ester carboxylesterase